MAEYLSVGPVDSAYVDVDAGSGAPRKAAERSTISITPSTSPIATARRCGLSSVAGTAMRWWGILRAGAGRDGGYKQALRRARRQDRGTVKAMALRRFAAYVRSRKPPRRPGPSPGLSSRGKRERTERQPGAQPRRQQGHVLLGARSVFDRPLRCRRHDRQNHPQDHRYRNRSPLREPAVPVFRRRLGSAPASGSSSLASAKDSRCSQ